MAGSSAGQAGGHSPTVLIDGLGNGQADGASARELGQRSDDQRKSQKAATITRMTTITAIPISELCPISRCSSLCIWSRLGLVPAFRRCRRPLRFSPLFPIGRAYTRSCAAAPCAAPAGSSDHPILRLTHQTLKPTRAIPVRENRAVSMP